MGGVSIAHNGNLTNALLLREVLAKGWCTLEQQVIPRQSFSL